jgi:hypothetical protein
MCSSNLPLSELFPIARALREDMLNREGGTGPDRLFKFRFSKLSVGK